MASVADARAKKLNDRVLRCLDLINSNDPNDVEKALGKLEQMDMTVDCLSSTKCGRILNRLKSDPGVGERASALVHKWRTMATEMNQIMQQKTGRSGRQESESPKSAVEEDVKPLKLKISTKKRPSNDFEAQLMQADRLPPKKKKRTTNEETRQNIPDDDDIARTLLQDLQQSSSSSEIRHAPTTSLSSSASGTAPPPNVEEAFDLSTIKRKERTRVYAGRRKAQTGLTEVPTLLQTCQRFLQNHLDQVDELGDAPYNILACVFERCTTEQLDRISEKNPRLHEDMNPIWERHVSKIFPNGGEKKKRETWYDCYKRLCRERNERLKAISVKINQRTEMAATPVRRTMLSDVINPLKMQKRQIRNGIMPTYSAPDAREVSHARREIFNTGSKSALLCLPGVSAIKGSVLASNSGGGRSSKSAPAAPRKGALMTKALKMFKNRQR